MFDWLKQKLNDIVQWFSDLAVEVFKAAWDFLKDGICWCFEQVLGVAVSAANSIDVSGMQDWGQSWGTLPGDILNVMGLLGVGTASGIIITAVLIRLLLQLIPFVRLGS